MKRIVAVLAVLLAVAGTSQAQWSGAVGVYSQYINSIGGVASDSPVVQGNVRYTFANQVYVDGWLSQSMHDPGRTTFANEFDFTVGRNWRFDNRWSLNAYVAYFDIAYPKVFAGTNGDLVNGSVTLRYHATATTSFYLAADANHGLGNRALPGGAKEGLGASSVFGPISADVVVYRNTFLIPGKFARVMLTTARPVATFLGGAVRPAVWITQPIGSYRLPSKTVVALQMTF